MLKSAGAKDANKATVDKIIKKFDEFFATRRNVIYERGRFNLRTQQSGESAEQFITALYTLSEWCEYGDMREELIHDRLIDFFLRCLHTTIAVLKFRWNLQVLGSQLWALLSSERSKMAVKVSQPYITRERKHFSKIHKS